MLMNQFNIFHAACAKQTLNLFNFTNRMPRVCSVRPPLYIGLLLSFLDQVGGWTEFWKGFGINLHQPPKSTTQMTKPVYCRIDLTSFMQPTSKTFSLMFNFSNRTFKQDCKYLGIFLSFYLTSGLLLCRESC